MRKFDEANLISDLERLPIPFRVVFAAACAERQMPAYRQFVTQTEQNSNNMMEIALETVWTDPDATKNATDLERQIEAIMQLIPQEDSIEGPWTQEATNAQNAGMAVAYALRAKLAGEAQEAAWAARVAYEALDNFIINNKRIDTNMPGNELLILSHPLVQAELGRQERDIRTLLAATNREIARTAQEIRDRARAEAAAFFGPNQRAPHQS
ncbi:DUF416 family protein [Sorangium sp. So ce291]|uniref:DUF416 family protein n=1 Tax=Sorangium sp. So ce291 TaxID=3133294 RepID=UPI003F610775